VIYLVRHGQTLWNVEGRLQGQKDSPLTAEGISQVRRVAQLLGEVVPDLPRCRVVASPLGRTWQTASLLCEALDLAPNGISFDPRLMEHHFGTWEGRLVAEIATSEPGAWAAREADKWNYRVPGGESYALVAARAATWLAEQSEERPVIAISHGLIGRVIRGLAAKMPREEVVDLAEEHDQVHRLSRGQVDCFSPKPALE